jgi:hypothetical protein
MPKSLDMEDTKRLRKAEALGQKRRQQQYKDEKEVWLKIWCERRDIETLRNGERWVLGLVVSSNCSTFVDYGRHC